MPRARRRTISNRPATGGPDAAYFLDSDGVEVVGALDGADPVQGGAAVARGLWNHHRTATWRLWAERPHDQPPQGAESFDGIQGGRRAVPTVAAFRESHPKEAGAIAAELEVFLALAAEWVELTAAWKATAQRSSSLPPAIELGVDDDDPLDLWAPTPYEPPPHAEPPPADVIPLRPGDGKFGPYPKRSGGSA